MPNLTCKSCKTSFYNKDSKTVYCSKACFWTYTGKSNNKNKECLNCVKSFVYENKDQKFCSQSCAATFNNKNRVLKGRILKSKTFCSCGNRIHEKSSCCKPCSGSKLTEQKNKRYVDWKDGKIIYSTKRLPVPVRKQLVSEIGKCSQCGWNKIHPFLGYCFLEVDHIDGNPFNNKFENVRVLCPNCHSLTRNYRNTGGYRKSFSSDT